MHAIRQALARGRPALGGWMFFPTVHSARLFAEAGFEWVVIDLQHGVATWESLPALVHALRLGGATVVVRVDWNSPPAIMRSLDLGADVVIIPMVNSGEEARAAAAAMRYPPLGVRSLGRIEPSALTPSEVNEHVLCLVMVETPEAVSQIDEIVATPGVDGVFFGPFDYAIAAAATRGAPAVDDAIERVVGAAAAASKLVATIAPDVAHAADLVTRGVRMVAVGSDRVYLRAGAERDVAAIAGLLSE